MIKTPDCYNRYHSAQDRFLKATLSNFFAREFPKLFGPIMREKLAEELLALVTALYPETNRLQPGQIFWNACYLSDYVPARGMIFFRMI